MKTLIISDFSKTFTDSSCPTTWSVFAKSGLLGSEYTSERDRLYGEYHDFELAGDIEKTKEWWGKHGELFLTFGLTKELIARIVADDQYFKPRAGLAEFLDLISRQDISLYIVTSGVKNFVDIFFEVRFPEFFKRFKQGKAASFWNRLEFNDMGGAVHFDSKSIITPLNKSEHGFYELAKISERVILLGDSNEDCDMFHGTNVQSFGFTDKELGFNVKLGKNASFSELISHLN